MEPRLKVKYKTEIFEKLKKELNLKNSMTVPKLEKIVLNMGVGTAILDKKKLEAAADQLTTIAGQKAVKTKAKKSIAGFKIREDMEIGCKVTLRGAMMYEFLDRLINVSLPRVKDFKGVKASGFDGRGNFSMGVQEVLIFPEIDFDKLDEIRGLSLTINTTAKNDSHAKALLTHFNMPFAKR